LQKKFDWAGVAAAGIGGGVMNEVGDYMAAKGYTISVNGQTRLDTFGSLVTGVAGDIANAATRSLIDGSDFGDNIMAALPDTIGQTIGNMIVGGISEPSSSATSDPEPLPGESPADYMKRRFDYYQTQDQGMAGLAIVAGPGASVRHQRSEGWLEALGDFLGLDGSFGYDGPDFAPLSLSNFTSAFVPNDKVQPRTGDEIESVTVEGWYNGLRDRQLFPPVDFAVNLQTQARSRSVLGARSHSGASLVEPGALPPVYSSNLQNRRWVNPTGLPVRGRDAQGTGMFGARRSDGTQHGGADWTSNPGQTVVAPTGGRVARTFTYNGMSAVSIDIGNGTTVDVLYIDPSVGEGAQINAGDAIGTAANMRAHYGPGMTNHVHVQIKIRSERVVVDPTAVIPTR
jgi:hypothetical protein